MRTRVHPTRPLFSVAAAAALSAVLLAGALPAHAETASDPASTAPAVAPVGAGASDAADTTPAAADDAAAPSTTTSDDAAAPAATTPAPAPAPQATTAPAAPAELGRPVILTPREGDTQTGGDTTFRGTGEPGADISLYVFAAGDRGRGSDNSDYLFYSSKVAADGTWSATEQVPVGFWTVKADQSRDEDARSTEGDVAFTVYPAAPVITSPAAAAHVNGRLHLTGTATAGAQVVVTITGGAKPVQVRADVRSDGTWSADSALASGSYSASAVESQSLPYERTARRISSAASASVPFTLSGGIVTTGSHSTTLPVTGTETLPLVALMGSLLLVGLALVVIPAIRRRRVLGGSTLRK